MRLKTTLGRLWGARSLAAAALLAGSATFAGAQEPIRFDGNILFNNGSGGTTNFSGTATGVGVGLCAPGVNNTTANIATVQFQRNTIGDPLLTLGSLDAPNWRPGAGSPAFCGTTDHKILAVQALNAFFTNVPWAGALGPSESDWTAGWTYYSLDGAGRTDLNDGAPLVILDNQRLVLPRTLSADSVYLVRGQLRVKEQASLTIPAGTVIFEESATVGTIIIERGAKIFAQGTAADPIIITSDQEPGSQAPGSTGGLFVHGRAKVNNSNSCAGDSSASEGGLVGYYGGNDDDDDSGVLQYVRVEFGGNLISEGNEANSFTFNGVGRTTQIGHLQAHRGLDDLFEFFGGVASPRYLVGTYGGDDGFDWQMGYRGNAQFVLIRQSAVDAGAEKGIEADNNEFDNDAALCAGRSNPNLANFTLIGDRTTTLSGRGVQFRRGTTGGIYNSIITNWRGAGFEVDSAGFANHCRSGNPVQLPTFCEKSQAAIVFDGNILFNNGSGGTTNFGGTATGAGTQVCQTGLDNTTANIATVQYVDNTVVDPQLTNINPADPTALDLRPRNGSPAIAGNGSHGKVVNVPQDGFFDNLCHVGAFGPGLDADWSAGWRILSLDGAGRTDLNDGAPLVILDNQRLVLPRTLSADSVYLVRGQLRVKEQASLTIPAGTVIFEESATVGTIIIERGAKIFAQGTAADPIIITSDQEPGSQAPGSTGGLFVHGRAKVNNSNSCAGDSSASEGGLVGYYGGNDDDDDSGVLQYVRVEFGGNLISEGNEANSFTFNGVGRTTQIGHLQAHRGLDDLFEFFGGTAQVKYLLGTYGGDDGFDWQMGYRGKAQYVAIRQLAVDAGAEKGIEADNNEFNNDATLCAGRSNPTLSHFTLVGDRTTTLSGRGVQFRRGTAGTVLNSIIANWRGAGFEVDSASFANHCRNRALAVRPGIACATGTVDAPLASGRVFVASGFPNPFRDEMSVRFALPRAGDVTVDVYTASGRHVAQLANGAYGAGEHTVKWAVGRSVPAGMYFYKVRTSAGESSGKLVRMP